MRFAVYLDGSWVLAGGNSLLVSSFDYSGHVSVLDIDVAVEMKTLRTKTARQSIYTLRIHIAPTRAVAARDRTLA